MNNFNNAQSSIANLSQAQIDEGLRSHMLRVYNYMSAALALTGIVAWFSATSGLYVAIANTMLIYVVMFAPLGVVFYFASKINSMSASRAQSVFWVFAGLMGLSLSYIFLAYTGTAVFQAFFVTAGAFAGLGLKLVNSDDILTRYLNKEGLSLKMPESEKEKRDEVRQKAKITTAARTDLYLQGRLGLIMDGTARDYNKISGQQRLFKLLGYHTIMLFVNTSLEVALERNEKRARSVPENIVRTSWATTQNNMGRYQKLFQPANFYTIDNSSSEKELVTTTLNKAASIVRRTMNQPHNFIAKQWIERQLRIKRR